MIDTLATFARAYPVLAFGAFFLLTLTACAVSLRGNR